MPAPPPPASSCVAQLGIQAAQVLQERRGELAAGLGNGTRRRELIKDTSGLACGDLLADAAGNQLAQHRMQAAGDLVARPAQVTVPLGPLLRYRGYADTGRGGAGGGGDRGGGIGIRATPSAPRRDPRPPPPPRAWSAA